MRLELKLLLHMRMKSTVQLHCSSIVVAAAAAYC